MPFNRIIRVQACACAVLAALPISLMAAEPATRKFDFGPGPDSPGYTKVQADTLYSAERGYGLEAGLAAIEGQGKGKGPQGDFLSSTQPFYFSVAVPEGNYRVTLSLGDRKGTSATTVKAESRRLMLEDVKTKKGEIVTRSFIVNVRNTQLPPPEKNAPGGTAVRINDREQGVRHWDDKLTLEFDGPAPKIAAVEIEQVDVPTLFLLGDSTVTDQPMEPGASWGQMLPRFLKPGIAVANHAESGETLKSFLTGLRLDKVLSQIKPGDWVFIQFGHNDEKKNWPQTYVDPANTYRDYLRVYVAEARRRGATPVLITSMHRRKFDEQGRIVNTHGDYLDAVRAVAKEENVALIDLADMSAKFYDALGPERSPLAFSNNGLDATHHDNYGAYELARCVVEGIKANRLPLAALLADDVQPFDPAHPDAPETFKFAASPGRSTVAPRGN